MKKLIFISLITLLLNACTSTTPFKEMSYYEVEKGKGIAETLKKAHPELTTEEANKMALKAAEDLQLKVFKTKQNEYVVIVKPGFKFALMSDGSYKKIEEE